MKTIKVLGQSDERLKAVGFGKEKELENFTVSDAVQFASDRSSASYQYIKDLKDDDVVELIFEGDIHRWVTVAELEKDYKYSLSRGESTGRHRNSAPTSYEHQSEHFAGGHRLGPQSVAACLNSMSLK